MMKQLKRFKKQQMTLIHQDFNPLESDRYKNIIVTTGPIVDGYRITSYQGLVSGEKVIGTGFLFSFEAGLADFLGDESQAYSNKMKEVKYAAMIQMLSAAYEKNVTAIIGISFQYMSLSRDLIAVSVNGTAVRIDKEED